MGFPDGYVGYIKGILVSSDNDPSLFCGFGGFLQLHFFSVLPAFESVEDLAQTLVAPRFELEAVYAPGVGFIVEILGFLVLGEPLGGAELHELEGRAQLPVPAHININALPYNKMCSIR